MINSKNNQAYIFGGLLVDYYYKINKWPDRSQDAFIKGEFFQVGGCAINMAVTISNLGAYAHVVSSISNDDTGNIIKKYIKNNGLSDYLLKSVDDKSGKCLVFLEDDGERTFLTSKGAEEIFTNELNQIMRENPPKVAGVTGYYLLSDDAEKIMDCLEYLYKQGTRILFDPSPLVGEIDQSILKRILEISYIITPNKTEFEIIESSISFNLKKFCSNGGVLVLKNGSQGGKVYKNNNEKNTLEHFDYKAENCQVVDTTGAGDSFAGALIYSIINDMVIEDAIKLAVKVSAKVVQIKGPHGFWSKEEI